MNRGYAGVSYSPSSSGFAGMRSGRGFAGEFDNAAVLYTGQGGWQYQFVSAGVYVRGQVGGKTMAPKFYAVGSSIYQKIYAEYVASKASGWSWSRIGAAILTGGQSEAPKAPTAPTSPSGVPSLEQKAKLYAADPPVVYMNQTAAPAVTQSQPAQGMPQLNLPGPPVKSETPWWLVPVGIGVVGVIVLGGIAFATRSAK